MPGRLEEVLKNKGIPYQKGILGAQISTIRIGGPISLLVEPLCVGELIETVRACVRLGLGYAVIGAGSNLLLGDGVIDTVLIRTTALDSVRMEQNGLCALCGARLPVLVREASRAGLKGLSFACGIPGTLGGAVCMNAGAHGAQIGDVIHRALVYDPLCDSLQSLPPEALGFSYRKSVFQEGRFLIISAVLSLSGGHEPQALKRECEDLLAARRLTQPLDRPSAGSFFRRPSPDISVSKAIDELGLKGASVGGACVSQKHAGFIVNMGGATAEDVLCLAERIQNILERERGYRPALEVRFIPCGE